MNKTTIIYILVILVVIYLFFNLRERNEKYNQKYIEKFTQTSVPEPNIYLPLTNFDNTRYTVDLNKKPVIINGLSKSNFDPEKGVFFDGSNNKYIMTSGLSNNYTICFNIYVTNIAPNVPNTNLTFMINQGNLYDDSWSNGLGLFVVIDNENTIKLRVTDPILYNSSEVKGSVSLLNKWNFICVTVSTTSEGFLESTLWINGEPYLKGRNREWASANFILGGQLRNGNSFTGYMRDFMSFTSKLSSDEIKSLNAVVQVPESLKNMLVYKIPNSPPSSKYNITIPESISKNVITFNTAVPLINPSNSVDNYTNYISMMNPMELKDNILKINGSIINLFDLSIFDAKLKAEISFNNTSNTSTLYAILNNSYSSVNYISTQSYSNIFKLSVDQVNDLSTTIQYSNIVFLNPTIKLYNTLTDKYAITFAINSFTLIPNYTTPSQFKIINNINSWNNNLVSINLSLTHINNILTCQPGNSIRLKNFTSINPLTLSYNDIVINKFNSSGNGIFTIDPTTISTIPLLTYEIPQFTLKNVVLSSPDMLSPLSFSDMLITPVYT